MNTFRNILMLVVVVAFLFAAGCGTIHGICEDGKTAFTGLSNVTRSWAESEADTQRKWEEDSQLHQQKRTAYLLDYQQKKDKATADVYNRASTDINNQ